MRPRRLVVAGTILVDVLLYFDRLPEPGGVAIAKRSVVTPGAGFNVLAGASRLGLASAYAGLVGTGPHGRRVSAALASIGTETLLPPAEGEDTGFDVGLVEIGPGSQPTFLGVPGIESRLRLSHLSGLPLKPGDAIYVSGYGLWYPDQGAELSAWIGSLGPEYLFVFDPGPLAGQIPVERLAAAMEWAGILSLNTVELAAIVGQQEPGGALPDPGRALERLAARLTPGTCAVVRAGADRCWVAVANGPAIHLPTRSTVPMDTTGAGDAHIAALLARLAAGDDVVQAARWANIAASLAIERAGPSTCPSLDELTKAAADAGLIRPPPRNQAPGRPAGSACGTSRRRGGPVQVMAVPRPPACRLVSDDGR